MSLPSVDTSYQKRFYNREWSWLHFNERVLEEAEDPSNPLLERVKFLSIFASNLDEFFMVRVAGLYRQVDAGIEASGTGRRSPEVQIDGVADIVGQLIPRQERVLEQLLQELGEQGVRIAGIEDVDPEQREYLHRYYHEVIYPVITPMIVGPTHPFPRLHNCTLYLALRLHDERAKAKGKAKGKDKDDPLLRIGFVGLPRVLPRFIDTRRPGEGTDLVPIESVLVDRAAALFSGYEIRSLSAIRVTRDADIYLDEAASEDLRRAMSKKLLGRRHGVAVRLEHGAKLEGKLLQALNANLDVDERQRHPIVGLMQLSDLMQLYSVVDRPDLKDRPLTPLVQSDRPPSIFDWLKRAPRLLYHPYHAFDPVAELVQQAADDPDVLAIKQCLYRTTPNSPVVRALTKAAESGKQVTVAVELRARFDEERNIEWAERLEQSGAHVVYGLVGLKTHCKALLVVRREPEGIRRYVHFATGNYNDATARVYTDMGLMAADDLLGGDASALFNVITGATLPPEWDKVEMSPTGLRRKLRSLIAREIDTSARRSRGRIIAKMNALVDRRVIEELYRASQAGVEIDLIVRSGCCLRPGVPGLSETIRVRSIVGRFLEHARVFYFRNGGQEELYLSSADWMPRNLDHRIELMFPIEDQAQREYVMKVLELQLKDNVKARELQPDGRYARVKAKGAPIDSQLAIYEMTAAEIDRRMPSPAERRFVPLGKRTGTTGA